MQRRGLRNDQWYRTLHSTFGNSLARRCYRHRDEFSGSIQDVIIIREDRVLNGY